MNNKIFDISKLKNKQGVFAGVFPRGCGKTTAVLNSMGPNDYYLAPNYMRNHVWRLYGFDMDICTRHKMRTRDGRIFLFYDRPPVEIFRGHSIYTLFIDDFLSYLVERIRNIIYDVYHATQKNIIMVSSGYDYRTIFDYGFPIYHYSTILPSNRTNLHLPDKLFVL